MTLYDYQVIYNPISDWITAYDYFVGNKVVNDTVSGLEYFQCILDHTSSGINEPGDVGSWMTFWVQIFPTNPNVDITSFVETIKETEIGSGDVRSLSLRINANKGAFITITNGGVTPIIDQFDKISVSTTDRLGDETFTVYEVDIIHPTLDGAVGIVLPVDLLGSEFYLQKTLFSEQFFFKSMFNASSNIVNFYNQNKGTSQVQIIGADANSSNGGFNDLPNWTANDYTFNLNELPHYDGLLEVIDRGGSSVAAGGAGDFFELGFTSSDTNVDQINFRGFSSGFPADQTSIPIITNQLSVNPAEQEGDIQATQGTVVGTWCEDSVGRLPRQNADFQGGLEAWRLFPEFVSGETYPEDAIILEVNTTDSQGDNIHYKANTETTQTPPDTDWDQYFFTDFLTNEVATAGQYSFWTNNREDEFVTCCANTDGNFGNANPDSIQVWDSNQVKIDGEFYSTWADVRATDPSSIPSKFLRNGNVYRGFRVLVDGTGTGDFTGFDNDIMQWNGEQWLQFFEPEPNNLVEIDAEAKTYQFNSGVWSDVTTSINYTNDVYHPVFAIYNSQGHVRKSNGVFDNILNIVGLGSGSSIVEVTVNDANLYQFGMSVSIAGTTNFNKPSAFVLNVDTINDTFTYDLGSTASTTDETTGTIGANYGNFSAVTFEYQMNFFLDNISGLLNSPEYYRQFAGACFRVPFPFNEDLNQNIGSIYGNNDSLEPATFEAENMALSASGLSGFNNIEAEDKGPFDALTFFIKHEQRYRLNGLGNLVINSANYAYRCALYDIDDTVVTHDFVVPFNNLWEPVSLPISGFQTYKARASWAFGNAAQNIFLQEIEVLNSFRWRNIKKIAIHWLGPYDDQGRYKPFDNGDALFATLKDPGTGLPADGFNIKVSIDSLEWAKPGLAVSEPIDDRPLQPQFFYEQLISNKYQLDQVNLAKLEITKFRHKGYDITTVGLNDLRYGDSFFLENAKLVNDEDLTTADMDVWAAATRYIEKDFVQDSGTGYRCIADNLAGATNRPGSGTFWENFWEEVDDPVPNTIKLVAKKIERLIDKVPTGPGGFLRTITGVRRFEEGEQ